jgi:hypothetical protein
VEKKSSAMTETVCAIRPRFSLQSNTSVRRSEFLQTEDQMVVLAKVRGVRLGEEEEEEEEEEDDGDNDDGDDGHDVSADNCKKKKKKIRKQTKQ